MRIRQTSHKSMSATFKSQAEAESLVARTTEERKRGLYTDYSASLKVSLADIIVRYMLEEAPKHRSHKVLAYSLQGWLTDRAARLASGSCKRIGRNCADAASPFAPPSSRCTKAARNWPGFTSPCPR